MAVRAQLLQSGLLGSIGPALTAAAEDLRLRQPQPDHAAAHYWPTGTQEAPELVVSQQQLLLHSFNLLTLWLCFHNVVIESGSTVIDDSHALQQVLAANSAAAASLAASAAAAMQLAAAVMKLASQHIPQLVAADHLAVLQAVHPPGSAAVLPGGSKVDTTVAGRAGLLFDCVRLAYAEVRLLAMSLTGDSVLTAGSFRNLARLPDFRWLLAVCSFVECQSVLLRHFTASTAPLWWATTSLGGECTVGMPQLKAAQKALSACDTAQLQLLGVSSEAAVWIAGRLIKTETRRSSSVGSTNQGAAARTGGQRSCSTAAPGAGSDPTAAAANGADGDGSAKPAAGASSPAVAAAAHPTAAAACAGHAAAQGSQDQERGGL